MEQLQLNLEGEPAPRKKPRTAFTGLIYELGLPKSDIPKESAMLRKILAKGFTDRQIYQVINYLKMSGRKIDSFGLLVWKDCEVIRQTLAKIPPEIQKDEEKVKYKLEEKDYRTKKEHVKPKGIQDFLS